MSERQVQEDYSTSDEDTDKELVLCQYQNDTKTFVGAHWHYGQTIGFKITCQGGCGTSISSRSPMRWVKVSRPLSHLSTE